MLLEHVLTELLLAKDYTPMAARRREEVLREFITWAKDNGATNVEDVTRSIARRYVAYLRDKPNARFGGHLSSETQHSRASIVRMFLRFAVREDWLDERVVAHFDMPKKAGKVVQIFTHEHFARLLKAADSNALPASRLRDKALLSLMLDTGIRAIETCTLTRDALFTTSKDSYIRVEGKGRRQREIGVGKQASLALHRYLTKGRPKSELPFVFLSRAAEPMTTNAIDRTLYRLRDVAGRKHFEGIRVSAHTLRHSFAVHYMQQGSGDIYKLSRLLGHENVTTTERYLRAFQARDARRNSRSVLDNL
jgi:site-specific recombinase XerD